MALASPVGQSNAKPNTLAALAYEQAIVVIYGRHLPKAWAIDLSNLTFGEIYQKIAR